ncbi:CHAT domain-containing protein [Gammaproteobacteria bacterium]|nr:CHAT domain-containing protein [Gammaproteobacteria bacterium]
MKHLLTLISLICIFSVNAKNIEYVVQSGDTLYSISKVNNISINEIYKINNELGFSPNQIYAGKIIYLPRKESIKYLDKCFSRVGNGQFNPYKTDKEVAEECISLIENQVNPDNIDFSNIKELELLYLINKTILDSRLSINAGNAIGAVNYGYLEDQSLIENTFLELAKNGNSNAAGLAYRLLDLEDLDFNNFIIDESLLIIRDNKKEFKNIKRACNEFDSNSDVYEYDLLLYFYLKCTDAFFDNDDNDYIKFDLKISDLLLTTNSNIVRKFELYAVSNVLYHLLNTGHEINASIFANKFLELKCPDCNNSPRDFFNKYAGSSREGFNRNLIFALHSFNLNHSSTAYTVDGVLPDQIINFRKDIIDDLDWLNPYDKSRTSSLKADYLSDTAMLLIRWGTCDLAKGYMDKAIEIYKSPGYDNSNLDYFDEPLYLSICFLEKAQRDIYESDEQKQSIDSAFDYLVSSSAVSIVYNIEDPIRLVLLDIVEVYLKILAGDEENFLEDNFNKFINLSSILMQHELYEFSGNIELFDTISSVYVLLYEYFSDPALMLDLSKLIDPLSIASQRENFLINSRLISLKVNQSNKTLLNLQEKLKLNNLQIKNSNNDSLDYGEMLKLYKNNTNIIEQILETDQNIKLITSPRNYTIESIQNSLNDDEYAYFFIPSKISSRVILIGKNTYNSWKTSSINVITPILESFVSEINPSSNYDFDTASLLKFIFFDFLDQKNEFIPKGSTIYLYTDVLMGLPPGVLIHSYNDSSLISEYERLLTADWLINDYNFTTKLNYENKNNPIYEEPFLGIGNSTTYEWLGLPDLNEVDSEITSLALASLANKDDLLLGKLATKEYFLSKLSSNYKRIVISTHSVPANWRGLTEEPALVFNSNNGDYFLTPSEIINTNMNSDMVVLSSCNASIDGFDDVFKSFLIAGSKSVVHSNWNLESRYAKEFTTTFFRELWLNDADKHDAIRNVSLKFLNDYSNQTYAHPAYWGNFSIVYSSAN